MCLSYRLVKPAPQHYRLFRSGLIFTFLFVAFSVVLIDIEKLHSLSSTRPPAKKAVSRRNARTLVAATIKDGRHNKRTRKEMTKTIAQHRTASSNADNHKLHFLVAGFPKCGTTTLLYAFGRHHETSISKREECAYINPSILDRTAFDLLDEQTSSLSGGEGTKKLGIKCPSALNHGRAIERIQKYSPNTKLIIGVRHPVNFLQSYYNYRITEIYDKHLEERIPPIEQLIGPDAVAWKGINSERARFDLFLMQLGKTNMTMDDLYRLRRADMSVKPTTFPIFLYSLDQMEDTDSERSAQFRQDLSDFLELKEPLSPLGRENINHFVGRDAHTETINICQDQYKQLRQLLVRQGRETEAWIRTSFLSSPDVTVSNRQFFLSSISKWRIDPCKTTTSPISVEMV